MSSPPAPSYGLHPGLLWGLRSQTTGSALASATRRSHSPRPTPGGPPLCCAEDTIPRYFAGASSCSAHLLHINFCLILYVHFISSQFNFSKHCYLPPRNAHSHVFVFLSICFWSYGFIAVCAQLPTIHFFHFSLKPFLLPFHASLSFCFSQTLPLRYQRVATQKRTLSWALRSLANPRLI